MGYQQVVTSPTTTGVSRALAIRVICVIRGLPIARVCMDSIRSRQTRTTLDSFETEVARLSTRSVDSIFDEFAFPLKVPYR